MLIALLIGLAVVLLAGARRLRRRPRPREPRARRPDGPPAAVARPDPSRSPYHLRERVMQSLFRRGAELGHWKN